MKKNSILYSIVTLCMMLFAVAGFAQINTNGGFESWSGTWPDGWNGNKTNINASNVVLVTSGAHTGNNACQLINTTTSLKRLTMQPVSVSNGEQYVVSLWVKGHGDIRVGLYTNTDNYYDYKNYHIINNTQYEYIEDTITVGISASAAEFIVGVKNTNDDDDNLIIDDVTVTAIVNQDFVAEPTATIAGNAFSTDTYFASATVTLSTITQGASIYYTLDGSTPTNTSTLYSSPITLTQTTTMKAIAELNGNTSTVLTKAITILDQNPLFFENFEANGLNQMSVENVSGTYAWGTGTYNNNTYANANAYNLGATESWLITPAITPINAGGVVLSFSSAKNYTGPDIQVKYSTNYSGTGNPSTATWTDVTSDCTLSSGSWTWTNSGDVEVAGASPIYFAWIYTSEASSAAGWEIDNIMVLPGEAPVLTPTLSITAPANGSNFSTLDTLPLGIAIQNFTLGTDGYLKVETPLLTAIGQTNPVYLDQTGLNTLLQAVLSPLPAGTHTITCSLVDMNQAALTPAVSATTTFTVTMPQLTAPVITATGSDAGAENTFYFNATVNMTAANDAAIHYTTDGSTPTETSTLYTAPFQVTATTTVKAIAVKANWQSSDVATLNVTITAPTVETPTFTPGTGTYADSVTFSIACTTDGAVIRYTTDGTEPTATSTLYSSPITLTTTTTVKAKAFKTDWFASETATATYIVVYDPILTVDATSLSFNNTQLTQTFTVSGAHLNDPITLTCYDIHFTINPSTITNPNSNTVVTVTFDGVAPTTSTIIVASDTLFAHVYLTATAQLPAPFLSPVSEVSDSTITVTMSTTITGAEVRYTTDGTEPTATSTLYSAPIVFSTPGTYTVKAIAVKTGWENSTVTMGTYTVNEPPAPDTVNVPVITPANDTYYEPQTVTITCTDADAVIRYTLDGSVPTETSTEYTAPFPVSTTTTITAKAWKTGMIPSGTSSVTISFPVQVANIAAFKAEAATNQERQIMSNVTFVFRSGRYMYVEDNTAAMLIYDNNNPVITTQYNEGDVIEGGIFGKYTLYQGMVEMVPTHNSAAATGTPVTVTPTDATITDIKAQYTNTYEAKLVHLSDVEFISATKFVQNGDTMAIYNRFNTVTTTIAAGDVADVTGFVSYSTNYGYQIYPRGNDDIDIHPVVMMDTVATPVFYVYRSGEFYFMNLTCATEGASIYYTFDGTTPNESSTLFTTDAPLNLEHYTLKAIAMKEGMVNSAIAVYDFDPSGIASFELRDNLSIYPNPAINNVTISTKNGDLNIEKVELYTVYGQLLRSVEVNSNRTDLPIESLATGTYFVKVFTDKGITTMPMIRK